VVPECLEPLGRMVEINASGSYSEVLYSPMGKVAIMSGQTATNVIYPMPGGGTLLAASTNWPHYQHPDWLGSARLQTEFSGTLGNSARSVDYDRAFAPFGETYDTFGSTVNLNFTGDNRTMASAGLYDTINRELHPNEGRWISPDPAGVGAVDPSNPQSWNRYAYVMNNPLSSVDPDGLWCVWEDGTHDEDPGSGGIDSFDCASQGGHWDAFDTITGIFQQNGIVTQINSVFPGQNCTTSDCGAGTTLEGFDQTLATYTRGDVPAPDFQIYGIFGGLGGQVIQLVGLETAGFNKQANCIAAGAYPFIPGPKPDDVNGLLTDTAAETLDSAAGTSEASAEALKRAYRLGQGKSTLQRSTAQLARKAKLLGGAATFAQIYGYATAAMEGAKNFKECESGK
jgi:RHS repeat-associated protein